MPLNNSAGRMSSEDAKTNTSDGKLLICLRDLSKFRDGGTISQPPLASPEKPSPVLTNGGTPQQTRQSPEPGSTIHRSNSCTANGCGGGGLSDLQFQQETETVKSEPTSGSTPPPSTSPTNRTTGGTSGDEPTQASPTQVCSGARQLNKLKRFLTTLQQFASDISPEIGERVHSLVIGLVNSRIAVEDFHQKLQEATNFPLRPFVIPFLKANLPLLQRELLHSTLSTSGLQGEHSPLLFEFLPLPFASPSGSYLGNSGENIRDCLNLRIGDSLDINENGKRRTQDLRRGEGGFHTSKRPRSGSPVTGNTGSLRLGSNGGFNLFPYSIQSGVRPGGGIRPEDVYGNKDHQSDRDRDEDGCSNVNKSELLSEAWERFDDQWSHVDSMLQCIVGMVDKCKRTLAVLQLQSRRDLEELSLCVSRHDDVINNARDVTAYRNETVSGRRPEDLQLLDVRQRAEEAVNEVKRQAMAELHRAVTAAEAKANLTVAAERIRIENMIGDIKLQARQEAITILNRQEESNENCWNCGRKASETCSGCNIARYCGAFCQHKDWETHHRTCRHAVSGVNASAHRLSLVTASPLQTDAASRAESSRRSGSRSPPTFASSSRTAERRSVNDAIPESLSTSSGTTSGGTTRPSSVSTILATE